MRLAQGYDAVDGNGRRYFSPDRQRLIDPWIRGRLAGYLSGGAPVAAGYRTDGQWVWHEPTAIHALECRVAPEEAFFGHIEAAGFRPPDDVPDDAVTRAERLIGTGELPDPAPADVEYYIRVDDDFPPEAPLSLLRRIRGSGDDHVDQAIWRDLRWHPTNTFVLQERNNEYDIRAIPPERAAEILDRWCAKWSAERSTDGDGPGGRESITTQRSDGMARGGS